MYLFTDNIDRNRILLYNGLFEARGVSNLANWLVCGSTIKRRKR